MIEMFFFVIVWRAFSVCFKALFSALTRILVWKTKLGKKNPKGWTPELYFLFFISSLHLELPYLCADSERLGPQQSVEYGHLHHNSMSLFSKASFDVRRERFASETALLSEKCPRMQKQTLIHVYFHSKWQFLCLSLSLSLSLYSVSGC